jgi:hypothetical protein
MADVRVLDELILEAGAFYVMDRAYVDFHRLHRFVLEAAFYVTRSKSTLRYRRLESRPVERQPNVSGKLQPTRNFCSHRVNCAVEAIYGV